MTWPHGTQMQHSSCEAQSTLCAGCQPENVRTICTRVHIHAWWTLRVRRCQWSDLRACGRATDQRASSRPRFLLLLSLCLLLDPVIRSIRDSCTGSWPVSQHRIYAQNTARRMCAYLPISIRFASPNSSQAMKKIRTILSKRTKSPRWQRNPSEYEYAVTRQFVKKKKKGHDSWSTLMKPDSKAMHVQGEWPFGQAFSHVPGSWCFFSWKTDGSKLLYGSKNKYILILTS